MSMLDPIRTGMETAEDVLKKKIAGLPDTPGYPVTITVADVKALIAALEQARANLPASLPFGF